MFNEIKDKHNFELLMDKLNFCSISYSEQPKILPTSPFVVHNSDSVVGIYGRCEESKRFLLNYMDDSDNTNYINRAYDFSNYPYNNTRIASRLLSLAIQLLELTGSVIIIETRKDSPIVIKNENFGVIIAPTIEVAD